MSDLTLPSIHLNGTGRRMLTEDYTTAYNALQAAIRAFQSIEFNARDYYTQGLHLQMIGRCLRPQAGKTAVILDHVGNTQRLGHHLEEREWSLDGTPKKDREASPSVKVCPKCFSCMPSAKQICPDCGHEFVAERRELVHVDGELQEVTRAAAKREQATASTLEDLIQIGKRRGMKHPIGWARHVMAARQTKGHCARVS